MKKILLILLLISTPALAAITTTFMEPGTDATQDFKLYLSTTTGGTGTITSDSTKSVTGPRSFRATQGAGAGNAVATAPSGAADDTGGQFSYWMYFDALPAAANQTAVGRTVGSANVFETRVNTNGTLRVVPTGGTGVDGTYVMSINTWYRVVVSYYIATTTDFQFKAYLHSYNGALLDTITANAGTMTRTASSRIAFGMVTGSWGNNTNLWMDDIYASIGGASKILGQPDLPEIRITAKRPLSNGTTNGFTGTGTPSSYGSGNARYVNEQPASVTNYVSMVGAGAAVTEEYNIEGPSVGDVNVSAVNIVDVGAWIYTSSLVGENASIILNNATSTVAITSTNTAYFKFSGLKTYPAGTGADVGEITDTSLTTVSLFEAGVLIAYRPLLDIMFPDIL